MKEILLIVWLISNFRRQLLLIYWWQVKEYRFDRFLVFLKTKEGQNKTDVAWLLAKSLLLLSFVIFKPIQYFYVIILLGETIRFFYESFSHQLRKPKITLRSLSFLLISFLFTVTIIFLQWKKFNLNILLLSDILSYLILLVPLFLTNLFLKIILQSKQHKAISVLRQYQPITIAITGSYGKSSTKHLLFELLNNFAPTVKTPASYNTILGITRTIDNLNPQTKYFLCEMGAYKKGEINTLCQIVKPDFAVITGICPQHLALFGNMDNLIKAKYEIGQNLKPGGTLFVNSSLPSTHPIISMAKHDKINVVTYALNQNGSQRADFLASITKQNKNSTTLRINTPRGLIEFVTNLTSPTELENLTGALAIALSLKITKENLKKTVTQLTKIDSGIKIKRLSPNINIIDDSYNSNPIGFEAALNTQLNNREFKVVVTDGIQELGKEAFSIHKNLGERLRPTDLILTTSPSLIKPFQAGLSKGEKKLRLIKQDIKIGELKRLIKTPAVILIEGRLPSQLSNTIYKLI